MKNGEHNGNRAEKMHEGKERTLKAMENVSGAAHSPDKNDINRNVLYYPSFFTAYILNRARKQMRAQNVRRANA